MFIRVDQEGLIGLDAFEMDCEKWNYLKMSCKESKSERACE